MHVAAARTLNLLLHRPHPSMQDQQQLLTEIHHCNGSVRMSNLPLDYVKEQTSSLALLKALKTRGTLRRSFKNASLWPPLFVHTALQF